MADLVSLDEVKDFLTRNESDVPDDDAVIEEARDLATSRLEDECRCAFVPREKTETVEAYNGTAILSMPLVISIEQIDGVAATGGPYPDGLIPLTGDGNHTVKYTHGHEEVPVPIKRAVLLLIQDYLSIDPSDLDRRATSKVTEMASWALVTPGVRGAVFPIPEVNQIIKNYAFIGGVH